MKKFILLLSASLLILSACNPNRIYETHQKDFPGYWWFRNQVIEFTPGISDTVSRYRIYLALRHVYGFQFERAAVKLTTVSPSGISESRNYEFPVFGPDRKYLSDCAEDICDLETVVEKDVIFHETGNYRFLVEHAMPVDSVPNVMEFGLIIEKMQ